MSDNNKSIGINEDYATIYTSDDNYNDILSAYYGYEVSFCPDHETEDECYDRPDECEKREWCFQYKEKGIKLIYTKSDLEEFCPYIKDRDPSQYLLAGILRMMDKGILEVNKGKLAGMVLKGKI